MQEMTQTDTNLPPEKVIKDIIFRTNEMIHCAAETQHMADKTLDAMIRNFDADTIKSVLEEFGAATSHRITVKLMFARLRREMKETC